MLDTITFVVVVVFVELDSLANKQTTRTVDDFFFQNKNNLLILIGEMIYNHVVNNLLILNISLSLFPRWPNLSIYLS